MKLPLNILITEKKLREYLLTQRSEDDKSGFLALAGYDQTSWRWLESDLRQLARVEDAVLISTSQYGDMYELTGCLTGPNEKVLNVSTFWIRLEATGETRFVTLVPDKRAKQ
jgi:hypothetical protein